MTQRFALSTAVATADLVAPLLVLVMALGGLAWWDGHVVPVLLEVMPLNRWPALALALYSMLHGNLPI